MLYAQPMLLRISNNIYAFVADAAVMVLSLPICEAIKAVMYRRFPEEIMG